jgi:predicted secreted protein
VTATQAISAKGTTLSRNGNVIAEGINISPPNEALETIDVTNHDSPSGIKEYIASLIDSGDVSIDGNFIAGDTNGQIGLRTDMLARTKQTFVLTFPTAITATFSFYAYVTAFSTKAAVKDKVSFTAKLKITGAATLAIGASTGLTTTFMSWSTGTLIPAAANAVYVYVLEVVTGTTTVTVTPTASAGVITVTANGVSQVVTSGAASSAITLGAAGSVTPVTISVQETGKVAVVYTVNVARA